MWVNGVSDPRDFAKPIAIATKKHKRNTNTIVMKSRENASRDHRDVKHGAHGSLIICEYTVSFSTWLNLHRNSYETKKIAVKTKARTIAISNSYAPDPMQYFWCNHCWTWCDSTVAVKHAKCNQNSRMTKLEVNKYPAERSTRVLGSLDWYFCYPKTPLQVHFCYFETISL